MAAVCEQGVALVSVGEDGCVHVWKAAAQGFQWCVWGREISIDK